MEGGEISNQLLYVARVLRDQLDDLLAGTTEALNLRGTLEFAAQHILVSQDAPSKNVVGTRRKGKGRVTTNDRRFHGKFSSEESLNPRLWSALPPQLLQLIFARLPLPDMNYLRFLCKAWKGRIETGTDDSIFRQSWGETSTSKFALLCPSHPLGSRHTYWVNAFDLRTETWHSALYTAHPDRHDVTIIACDGGLVCFMYEVGDTHTRSWQQLRNILKGVREPDQTNMVRFAVWNPAVGDEVELPELPVDEEDEDIPEDDSDDGAATKLHRLHTHPRAVHLSVDRDKKHFKVTVVSATGQGGNYETTVYDSELKRWTDQFELFSDTPIVHVGAGNWSTFRGVYGYTVFRTGSSGAWEDGQFFKPGMGTGRIKAICFAVTGDRGFLLHQTEGRRAYEIQEFRYRAGAYTTVKCRSCNPLDNLSEESYTLKLHACEGF